MSLRTRLLVALGVVAFTALVAADVVTYSALRTFLYDRVDQSLEASHVPIEREFNRDQSPGDADLAVVALGTFVQVRDSTGRILQTIPARRPDDRDLAPKLPSRITGVRTKQGRGDPHRYLTVGATEGGAPFRVRVSTIAGGSQLVLALPLKDTEATLHRLLFIEFAVTAGALLAAVALGWWLVRVGLRPLAEIEDTADAIAAGDLDRRVPEPASARPTEVGRLARALNTMLASIRHAFAERDATETELRRSEERLRRFVSDASHELRTPVAAVAAYAELFDRGAGDHPEDLARVMRGIRAETGRMGELVSDLLLLARLDEGRPLAREPVDLVALTGESVDAARAMGPEWPVMIEAEHPVEAIGDPARLRQVLDNLLANTRAHTPVGTPCTVRVADEDGCSVVSVCDRGPGLTAEQASRVFERFYRVDASRFRPHVQSGAGLGLAIVAAIVAAHDGEVRAAPRPDGGVCFTVRLPGASANPPDGRFTGAPQRDDSSGPAPLAGMGRVATLLELPGGGEERSAGARN